jgi:hypothetical protein
MAKIGFLFGAGAEACYGLPTGGRFALDIFRQDVTANKNEFINMRNSVDNTTKYAGTWLPDDYDTRSVSTYGKSVIENIIKDTLEHKREHIIRKLNDFDSYAEKIKIHLEYGKNLENIDEIISRELNRSISDCQLNNNISFNQALNEGNDIFKSNYFSALLLIYKSKNLNNHLQLELKKIIVSILQLQIGALGSSLVKNINDNIFRKKDEEIDLFDDIGEVLTLNYQSAGVIGVEYLYDSIKKENDENMDNQSKIVYFAKCILEDIFSSVLDYKSLIDSNWHYLYCPKNEWAKFCKISIFLLTVKNYIISSIPSSVDNNGYYDDLKDCIDKSKLEIAKIATTNYNNIIVEKIKEDITYLNGSVTQWYDPYLNKIDKKENLEGKFIVPLLFTQSGTKPMTSIYKSCEYVDLYRAWKDADFIVIIGFGFNKDDEHINGIIRTLINEDDKNIIVVDKNTSKKDVTGRLLVEKTENIEVYNVNDERKIDGKLWLEYILDNIDKTIV